MRLPIRNHLIEPLTLFIEPWCIEEDVPAGGQAFIILQDGRHHSIDVHPDRFITIWDEGDGTLGMPAIEIIPYQK